MILGEVVTLRTPETEARFGPRVIFATLVHRTSNYNAFDIHGGMSVMIKHGRGYMDEPADELYPTTCALCGAAEDTDDPGDTGFRNFYVSQHKHNAPMEQALCDAIGGEGFGRLCGDCGEELGLARARIALRERGA